MRTLVAVIGVMLLLTVIGRGQDSASDHPDYVADEKTAQRIGEAVLIGQFGQEQVKVRSPLRVLSWGEGKFWLVYGHLLDGERPPAVPGPFGVLINKHDGCLSVVEHLK